MAQVEYILKVQAGAMTDEVQTYCENRDITYYHANDIVYIEDDGNPLSEWVKKRYSFKFDSTGRGCIAIEGR